MIKPSIYLGSVICLKPEFESQYKVLHRHAFPEVLARIQNSNISDYTIFLHNGLLFSFMCYSGFDLEKDFQAIGSDDVTKEWWVLTDSMQQVIPGCPDGKWWADLKQIYEYQNQDVKLLDIERFAFTMDILHPDTFQKLEVQIVAKYRSKISRIHIFEGYKKTFIYVESSQSNSIELINLFTEIIKSSVPLFLMEKVFHTHTVEKQNHELKKVFVTGCFDMLHSGHVAFLKEASGYGDLYVCIGSDANVEHLKGRYPVNSEDERKYMISALSCVTRCELNSGWGIIDFEKELRSIMPDIFIVNEDGHTPTKQALCSDMGIEYKVLKRIPHADLPVRSTTALRTECTIPFRIDLAGGWLDQPFVSTYSPGPVLTISIEPTIEFNERSGMSSSTRRKAIELWRNEIPHGDREQLARMLFSFENPPGTKVVAGSQDSLGIVLPGLNKLDYNGSYWPENITSIHDEGILTWIEKHLFLITLGPRVSEYDVLENTHIDNLKAANLAQASNDCWEAICTKNIQKFGEAFRQSFEAQIAMFPNMVDESIFQTIELYKNHAWGWKLSGAGGGGYLIMVADKPIEGAMQIKIRRKNNL